MQLCTQLSPYEWTLFKKFSSEHQKKKTQIQWQTFICSSTFMSPNQQPGVPSRVCHLVRAISGGSAGWSVVWPTRHITLLLTKTSDREESGVRRRGRGELPEVVNTKCKKQFGPDISVINFMPVLGPSHYKSNQIKSVRCRHVRRSPRQCLTHLPCLLYTPRGNQATDESEPRCFDQRVDLSLGTQFMQFI